LLARLGVKVYPSENGKNLKITTALQFEPSRIEYSPQIISIASPKL
jgi:hypothetical protein